MLYEQSELSSISQLLSQKPLWLWFIIVFLVIIGLCSSCYGVYELFSTNDQEIVTSSDIETQVCEKTAEFGQITVYISGAITNPGVYILSAGDRINDLVTAAGGVSLSADKVYINKHFNLAKILSDGEQLYVPTKQESVTQLETAVQSSSQNSPISINSSTSEVLQQLSGIGAVKAEKIIENRPYSSLDELVEKAVISQSLFEEIESQIIL